MKATLLPIAAVAGLAVLATRRGSATAPRKPREPDWELIAELTGNAEEDLEMFHSLSMARRMGLPCLGQGGTRRVYDAGHGYVAKVALEVEDMDVNLTEAENWRVAQSLHLDRFFVPVTWCSDAGEVLVMPKVKVAESKYWRRLQYQRDRMRAAGASVNDDWLDANWGWHEGKLKLLDYVGTEFGGMFR